MPPKKTTSGTSGKATDTDLRFFEAYLKHMKSVPEVAWDAIAEELGLSHGNSARERFRQIKLKLGWATGPNTVSTPRVKRKAADQEAGVEDEETSTPSKKRKVATPGGAKGSSQVKEKTEDYKASPASQQKEFEDYYAPQAGTQNADKEYKALADPDYADAV